MQSFTVVLLLEDDQQRSQIAKTWTIKLNWQPVGNWQEIELRIKDAWKEIEQKYSGRKELRMPKTLHLRVGIKVEGTGVFYPTTIDARMRYKAIRVYPPGHRRYNFLKIEKEILPALRGAMDGSFNDIPDRDQILNQVLDTFALTNPLTEIRNSIKNLETTTRILKEQDTGSVCLW